MDRVTGGYLANRIGLMTWLLITVLVAAGAVVVVWILLNRVSEIGGTSDRDATEIAHQYMGEANALRGRRTPDDPPLERLNRLAPPTQDPGFLFGP